MDGAFSQPKKDAAARVLLSINNSSAQPLPNLHHLKRSHVARATAGATDENERVVSEREHSVKKSSFGGLSCRFPGRTASTQDGDTRRVGVHIQPAVGHASSGSKPVHRSTGKLRPLRPFAFRHVVDIDRLGRVAFRVHSAHRVEIRPFRAATAIARRRNG